MKMKTWLITLPFLFLAGGAAADTTAPDAAPAPADSAAAPTKAEAAPPAAAKAAKPKMRQRQGGDIRRCLDNKDNKAIIRCAEKGRKPVHKRERKHVPVPETQSQAKPVPTPEPAPAAKP